MVEHAKNDLPDAHDFMDPSPNAESDMNLAILCDLLQEQGVTRVVVRYEGTGDSGGVEEVEYEPAGRDLPGWVEDRLRDIAEGYCPEGYANNEGGYGTLTVYPFQGLAELEHADHYVDMETMPTPETSLPEALHQQLSHLGVRKIAAHFDGYGDSGQFEEVSIEPDHIELAEDLREELETFLLDQLPGGWEINEGSSGTFTVDVEANTIEADGYWRVARESEARVTRWKWRP